MTDAERDLMLGEILAGVTKLGNDVAGLAKRVRALETAEASEAAMILAQVREALKRIETRFDEKLAALGVDLIESRARNSERAKYDSSHDLAQDAKIEELIRALAAANERILQQNEQLSDVRSALTPTQERAIGTGKIGGMAGIVALIAALILEVLRQAGAK